MKNVFIPVGCVVLFLLNILGYLCRIFFLGIFLSLWHFKLPQKKIFLPYKMVGYELHGEKAWYKVPEEKISIKNLLTFLWPVEKSLEKSKIFISVNYMFSYKEE